MYLFAQIANKNYSPQQINDFGIHLSLALNVAPDIPLPGPSRMIDRIQPWIIYPCVPIVKRNTTIQENKRHFSQTNSCKTCEIKMQLFENTITVVSSETEDILQKIKNTFIRRKNNCG
jgi:hypothetical protein